MSEEKYAVRLDRNFQGLVFFFVVVLIELDRIRLNFMLWLVGCFSSFMMGFWRLPLTRMPLVSSKISFERFLGAVVVLAPYRYLLFDFVFYFFCEVLRTRIL